MSDRNTPAQEAQRQQINGEDFIFGGADGIATGDKLYLGDPDAVSEIVRGFCSQVHTIAQDADADVTTPGEAFDRLDALAGKYADIFYGKDGSYIALPFNSPLILGKFINQRLGMDEPVDQAAHTLLMNCANQILEARHNHQSGLSDDETTRFQIEAAIEDASHILLGLPPATADDD